jgi:alanine racemase
MSEIDPLRPTYLEVNLQQLRKNVEAIRAHVAPAKVLVMLKANAYGHGIEGVAPFIEPYVDQIGVAILDEGIQLRKLGITKPILVAGGTLLELVPYYLKYDLTLTVSSSPLLQAAEEVSKNAGKKLKVHLKIDTGMERSGIRWYEAGPFLEETLKCSHLDIEGIYTHFANSETLEEDLLEKKPTFSYASDQLARFTQVLHFYKERNIPTPPLRHTANSAAILNLPESYFDMVRPGVMFYGVYPDEDVRKTVEINTALTWRSSLVYFKKTRAGNPVSYGSLWAPEHDVNIGTIPCGYADGYFRRMSTLPKVIVNGKKYQQVGRICMDQCMVNLEADTAEVGNPVILMGIDEASGERITPEDLAACAGTNTYEVMTNISARVPRVFIGN